MGPRVPLIDLLGDRIDQAGAQLGQPDHVFSGEVTSIQTVGSSAARPCSTHDPLLNQTLKRAADAGLRPRPDEAVNLGGRKRRFRPSKRLKHVAIQGWSDHRERPRQVHLQNSTLICTILQQSLVDAAVR